jgi:hypothetical protein
MKLFKKEIVPLGEHLVSDKDGNRKTVNITEDRAKEWVKKFRKMKAEGLNVYAPWEHDFESKPSKDLFNAKNNGGKWLDLTLENGSLWGVIEAATDDDADKIGKTVEGCSLYADDYTDGKGNVWEDSILHICLTNKPVAATGNYTSIAMSTSVKKDNTSLIANLLESLKKIGICVTPTEDMDELLKMLTVALDNSPLKDSLSGGIPNNVTPKAPRLDLVMSTETQDPQPEKEPKSDISEKILQQNEELKSEKKALSKQLEKFSALFKAQAKKELESKITALSESLGDDEDGKKLIKDLKFQLESTEFSFDDNGEVVQTPLHKEIDVHMRYVSKKEDKKVEENSDKKPSNVIEKEVEDEPNDDPTYIDPKDVAELVASMPL